MTIIKELKTLDDYKILIEFDDHKIKIFDIKPYLDREVFIELKNINYFKLVKNCKYYIMWPNEQDLSGDTLYVEGKEVESPCHHRSCMS